MTKHMTHPSFGPVPVEKFLEAQKAPAGNATKILRQYDPLFGMVQGGGKLKTFSVTVTRRVCSKQWSKREIEAESKEQAEKLLDAMDWDTFNWSDGYGSEDTDDYEVDEIEESE